MDKELEIVIATMNENNMAFVNALNQTSKAFLAIYVRFQQLQDSLDALKADVDQIKADMPPVVKDFLMPKSNSFEKMILSLKNLMQEMKEIEPKILIISTWGNPRQKRAWDCYDVVWYKSAKCRIRQKAQGYRLGLFE